MITLFIIIVIFAAVFKFVWRFIKPIIKFVWKVLGWIFCVILVLYFVWRTFRDGYRNLQPGISDKEVFEDIKYNIINHVPHFLDNVVSNVGEVVIDKFKSWDSVNMWDTSDFKDSVVETISEDFLNTNVLIENLPIETSVETQVSSVEIVDDNTDKVVSETPVESPEFKKVKRGSSRKSVRKSRRNSRRKLRNS